MKVFTQSSQMLSSIDEKDLKKITMKDEQGWWFWDETWDCRYGPYGSEETAQRMSVLYADIVLYENKTQVSRAMWEAQIEKEAPGTVHPCTDCRSWVCDCRGACSCHNISGGIRR